MTSLELDGISRPSANIQLRPTKIAIIHGSYISGLAIPSEVHGALSTLFSPLGVEVFSLQQLGETGVSDLIASHAYHAIGFVGEIEADRLKDIRHTKFALLGDQQVTDTTDSIVLSFISRSSFSSAKTYLRFSDAVILCETEDLPAELLRIVYHFFESLVVPSLVNIDLADVSRIAHGIGLAFNISDNDHSNVIAKLPRDCFLASSALLHFACKDDVSLREIHSISNSIVVKPPNEETGENLKSRSEARNVTRKVNMKMGIRILDGTSGINTVDLEKAAGTNEAHPFKDENRISLTAVLFGV